MNPAGQVDLFGDSADEAVRAATLSDDGRYRYQHPGSWEAWLGALSGLRWRLRRLTGETQPGVETGAPCPCCAGRVVQMLTTTGRGDIRVCVGTKEHPGCGIEWATEAHFLLAVREAHEALSATHPDQLVTLDDAKRIYRRRVEAHTIDVWVNRGTIRAATREDGRPRINVRGEALYRLQHFELAAGGAREVGA